ncbi:hypothetical protein K32_02400 [Kaistia sp. 32K]|nr:hypothetical protein K32_02400 [Kaistia sp. 32K]
MREKLKQWVLQAVDHRGGKASIVDVARHIWAEHEAELKSAGDLFYTWQYDMRWAAQKLRDDGILAIDRNRHWVRAR